MDWNLADAKNRLSELITAATTQGPQTIRRRNDAVVVMSERSYLALTGKIPTLKQLLLNDPSLRGAIPKRDTSPMRKVNL